MKLLLEQILNKYATQWINAGVNLHFTTKLWQHEGNNVLEIWVRCEKWSRISLLKTTSPVKNPVETVYTLAILSICDAGLSNIYSTTIRLIRTQKIPYWGENDPRLYPLTPQETWLNKAPDAANAKKD